MPAIAQVELMLDPMGIVGAEEQEDPYHLERPVEDPVVVALQQTGGELARRLIGIDHESRIIVKIESVQKTSGIIDPSIEIEIEIEVVRRETTVTEEMIAIGGMIVTGGMIGEITTMIVAGVGTIEIVGGIDPVGTVTSSSNKTATGLETGLEITIVTVEEALLHTTTMDLLLPVSNHTKIKGRLSKEGNARMVERTTKGASVRRGSSDVCQVSKLDYRTMALSLDQASSSARILR